MNYISVENLAKTYGERMLFEGISFGLSKGDKTALIANNGTGKSTLLKILVGKDVPTEGSVVLRNGIRIGFLNQEPELDDSLTIDQFLKEGNREIIKVINEYEEALELQSENFSEENQKKFELAAANMDKFDAWDYERKITQTLGKFSIHDLSQKIENLSGGQKKRLALAFTLLDNPDVLILDEPTNHLDVEMIEWLEDHLSQANITLLMVTHDRYFLNNVCNHILEIENGKLYHHKGNYEYFLQKRAEREEVYNIELGKAKQLMKKELEWMRKSPKARTTKSKSRINAFYDIQEKASQNRVKKEIQLDVKMSRIGGKILELKKIYKSYGDLEILKGFDYTFKKGEKIGIIGKNGVGKSTFLNIITGKEEADSGKINVGETIVFGHFTQLGIQLKEDKRVIEVLKEVAEYIVMADGSKLSASQLLEQFMFTPHMQYSFVSKLSGGERRRLTLLMVLIKNPNFLILDEPTNDLDLLTLQKLEEFLESFSGCLILVTHDRYFMDRLVDHFFVFEGNAVITDHYCSYSEYREKEIAKEKSAIKEEKASDSVEQSTPAEKKKLTYAEQIEYKKLNEELTKLESEKTDLETELTDCSDDFEKIQTISNRIGEINNLLDEKTLRVLELEEYL